VELVGAGEDLFAKAMCTTGIVVVGERKHLGMGAEERRVYGGDECFRQELGASRG